MELVGVVQITIYCANSGKLADKPWADSKVWILHKKMIVRQSYAAALILCHLVYFVALPVG